MDWGIFIAAFSIFGSLVLAIAHLTVIDAPQPVKDVTSEPPELRKAA